MSTDELIDSVVRWGRDHDIDNPYLQYAKVTEEVAEIAHEMTRGRLKSPEIEDALGDSAVTLIILANILGYDIRDCLSTAYSVIKERTGVTRNGSFIKDVK